MYAKPASHASDGRCSGGAAHGRRTCHILPHHRQQAIASCPPAGIKQVHVLFSHFHPFPRGSMSAAEAMPDGGDLPYPASVILANGWAHQSQLEEACGQLLAAGHDPTDVRILNRHLLAKHLITGEQAVELEAVVQHQVHFPQFTLLRKLGAGGMGTVFLAHLNADGREVALKTINTRLQDDPDFIGRFQRETKALSGLSHRHIAGVIESGEADGNCYMAMEYVNGPSLAVQLRNHQAFPEGYVLTICSQVAEGLAYVYEKSGLVHRDVKPENILIQRVDTSGDLYPESDESRLIDFGLVKPVHEDIHLTQTGMTIGTPLYMSPEQVRGEKLDCRSDIYSLGATMYHLLTGSTPFDGTSPGAIMSAHLTEPVPDPGKLVPSLHPQTRQLVMMAMAKKPDHRFTTHEAFIKAMKKAQDEIGQRITLKLLRKPMVLKGNQARNKPGGDTERVAKEGTSVIKGTSPSDTSATRAIAAAIPALGRVEDAGHTSSAAEALRDVHTDRIFASRDEAGYSSSPMHFEVPLTKLEESTVNDEDPYRHLGIGLTPWAVLALSVAALIAWFLLH
jgi:serine/threonine protein kinase